MLLLYRHKVYKFDEDELHRPPLCPLQLKCFSRILHDHSLLHNCHWLYQRRRHIGTLTKQVARYSLSFHITVWTCLCPGGLFSSLTKAGGIRNPLWLCSMVIPHEIDKAQVSAVLQHSMHRKIAAHWSDFWFRKGNFQMIKSRNLKNVWFSWMFTWCICTSVATHWRNLLATNYQA